MVAAQSPNLAVLDRKDIMVGLEKRILQVVVLQVEVVEVLQV